MNPLLRTALGLAVSSSLVLLPAGHGSVYPPPIPPPPIAAPNTGTAAGAGDRRAPTAPRAAGPAARPGSGVRGAGTPGAPLSPGAGRPGGPSTVDAVSLDRTSWHWWWEFNKEPFMQLRSRTDAAGALSGGDGFFLGHGRRMPRRQTDRRPSEAQVVEQILPALRAALATRESNDMISGSLIGLARIGNDRPAAERIGIAETIRPFLKEANRSLAEIAVVSMGILGHEPNAYFLSEVLLDTDAGRQAVGDAKVPDRMRAFAAYGLAVLGVRTQNEDVRRFVIHRLVRALESDETGTPDLSSACVIGLGRVPLAWSDRSAAKDATPAAVTSSREGQIRYLLASLDDAKRHRFVQAHAVTSLGSLLVFDAEDRDEELVVEVCETLVDLLTTRRKVPREVRQSAALALGMCADGDRDKHDVKIRRVLLDTAKNENDLGTRHFALLALGRVAARSGNNEAVDPGPARTHLLKALTRAGTQTSRWAGLGLALLERTRVDEGDVIAPVVLQAVHAKTEAARSPSDASAFSIASGILRDPGGIDEVLGQLERQSEDASRGYAAMALGLLDAREALDPLRVLVEESTHRPWLLRGTSLALGMLGDPDVVDVLLGRLDDTSSISAKASIARALGRIGDERAVDPLLEMLTDAGGTKGSRAFAAISLGLVADEDSLPWNTFLSVDMNYMAAPATLHDGQGFGILNIL